MPKYKVMATEYVYKDALIEAELLEDGVDKRRVLADFVRHGLYPDDC